MRKPKAQKAHPIVHHAMALRRLREGMVDVLRPDPEILGATIVILTESPRCVDYAVPSRPGHGR